MKKYLLLFAVLTMGMAAITSCSKDDEVLPPGVELNIDEPSITMNEGETLTVRPTYTNCTPETTYKWFVNNELVSTDVNLIWEATTAGKYVVMLEVTNADGMTKKQFEVIVLENLVTVTFEGDYWNALIDSKQYNGTLLYGDNALTYSWDDITTGLSSELTKAWGGSYGFAEGGVAISNYIDANINEHATYEYQLAVPTSNGSKNFAVVYCDASIHFARGASHEIRSMLIGPTTYELGVVTNGDGYALPLTESGNLTITITADNGKTLNVDMARDGKVMTTWTEVDLSSLGAVNSLTFTMDGSDRSDYGVKHPKYFAFDNVVVKL